MVPLKEAAARAARLASYWQRAFGYVTSGGFRLITCQLRKGFLSGYLINEAPVPVVRLVEVALIGPGVESGIGTEGTNTASFNSIKQTTSRLQHTASTTSNTLSSRSKQINKAF